MLDSRSSIRTQHLTLIYGSSYSAWITVFVSLSAITFTFILFKPLQELSRSNYGYKIAQYKIYKKFVEIQGILESPNFDIYGEDENSENIKILTTNVPKYPDLINETTDSKKIPNLTKISPIMTSSTKNLNFNCPFTPPPKSSKNQPTPIHDLNPEKYLLNISPFGPNNQLRGFRDTVILAIYLNRTVVIPPFFKHGTDPSYKNKNQDSILNNTQPGWTKIDVEKLAKFVPVISYEKFVRKCHNFDHAYFARRYIPGGLFEQMRAYEFLAENELGKNSDFLLKNQSIENFNKFPEIARDIVFPRNDGYNRVYSEKVKNVVNEQLYLPMKKVGVDMAYGRRHNEGRCAVWLSPFRNMYWNRALLFNQGDGGAKELAADMVNHVTRPKSVKFFSEQFINEYFSPNSSENSYENRYVSLHWRYDKNDYGTHCIRKIHPGNKESCEFLIGHNFQPAPIAEKLENYFRINHSGLKYLFVAAPPKEAVLLGILSEKLAEFGLKVIYSKGLTEFAEKVFRKANCDDYENQIHDFLSQLEQEICMRSWLFMPSDGSSWSATVTSDRTARGISSRDIENRVVFRENEDSRLQLSGNKL